MNHMITTEHEKTFWGNIKKADTCWIWTEKTAAGYGYTHFNKKTIFAHRFMWQLKYGEIEKGMKVCHKCDNSLCVKPDHLFLGTQKDNLVDMVMKDRGGRQKLTIRQAKEIRDRYSRGDVNQTFLGKLFGVTQTNISKITTRVSFASVT